MAEVITFVNYRPPARFDALPWTEVRIAESATETGTFTLLETIALSPLDADPAEPASRSFTTELGTAIGYWYTITFADADGDTSQTTEPIQNVIAAAPPSVSAYGTVDELMRRLKIRQPSTEQELQGQACLDAASLEIDAEVGRTSPYDEAPALVIEVCYQRAVEYWHQAPMAFNVIGLDSEAPIRLSRNSWEPYAFRLAPLKESWGMA
jgi:hypothetical protein